MKKVFAAIKGFFKKIGNKTSNTFNRAKESVMAHKTSTLAAMQLKDKWNLSSKTKKEIIFKTIAYVVLFAVITLLIYLVMSLSTTRLHIFFASRIPISAMTVLILFLSFFEFISILIGLTKALYFAKDNGVLITYPVKADRLFISKLIVFYLDALKKACVLLLPTLVAFGIIYAYGVYFYLWIILLLLIYIAFLVVLAAILSIPTYYVMKALDKYKLLKLFFSLIVLGVVVFLVVELLGVIPANINIMKTYAKFAEQVNNFLTWFNNTFKVSSWITAMFCGVQKGPITRLFSWYSLIVPVCIIGAIALLTLLNMGISKPFYTKMIANTSHRTKVIKNEKANHKRPKYLSVVFNEFLRIVRNEKQMASTIISVVMMPLIVLVFNKIYLAIDLSDFGVVMISLFNYFFVILVVTSHNITTSYIYSKDGPSWNINKTIPVNPRISLLARLVYNTVTSFLIIIPGCILYSSFIEPITSFSTTLIILSMILLTFFHSLLSASFDYSHSENKDKADIGSEIVGKHEAISLLYALTISFGAAVFLFILYKNTFSLPNFVASDRIYLRVLLFSIALVAFELFMFTRKIKVTFQEN